MLCYVMFRPDFVPLAGRGELSGAATTLTLMPPGKLEAPLGAPKPQQEAANELGLGWPEVGQFGAGLGGPAIKLLGSMIGERATWRRLWPASGSACLN